MTERRNYILMVFRYIENIVREEFVNLAVCLVEDRDAADSFAGFVPTQNWERIQAFFPQADISFLREWCAATLHYVESHADPNKVLIEKLSVIDGNISVVVHKRGMQTANSPTDEMHELTKMYLG